MAGACQQPRIRMAGACQQPGIRMAGVNSLG